MFRYIAVILTLLCAAPLAARPLTADEIRRIDKAAAASLAATGVPTASVAVVLDGAVVFTRTYAQPGKAPPAVSAPYQIASVSKQFTAAAILMLRDEGKLNLDDPVGKYVPGISGGDHMTIRQLLSHTSGLQDYWPQDYSFQAMETPTTPEAIIDRWGHKPLDFAPGTDWQYSNTGYVVAGMIVEKVAGEPLLALLQRRIFAPLGITAYDQDKAVGPGFLNGYHRNALGPVRVAQPAARGWLFAAGELAMSPADLAKWNIARIDRTVLPLDDWEEQEKPIVLANGKPRAYGLGVSVRGGHGDDGPRMIEHGGEAVGFLTENIVFPEARAAISVAVNADFGDSQGAIAQAIAQILLPPAAKPDPEARITAHARAVFEAMRAGTLDRRGMTEDWNYFFTAQVAGDYRASLAPLGSPVRFEPLGGPRLRGGFVNRNYEIAFAGGRKLTIITYAEPGDAGRYEQFLISPAQ